ncbi:inositol phosphate phosphatase SopB [Pantoea cypripedii]
MGQSASDKYNAAAFNQLLGQNLDPSAPPGGMVGEYLKAHPENREKVLELCQQLKEIYNKKSHHYDGGEPYKAAQRMAMLAYEIGAVPAYNCKSGKDRTGMLDAEIKREVVSQYQGRPLSKPGNPLNEYDKKLFQKVLVSGGNAEVQKYNTGVAGNKVLKELPLVALNLSHHDRIGNRDTFDQVAGLSELAKY